MIFGKEAKIIIDTDEKGFSFNGKSSGNIIEQPTNRQIQINELTKVTKEVKDVANKMKGNGKDKEGG